MLHVKEITALVEEGELEASHDALDNLLALGPGNTAALKLRAKLLGFEGRFTGEAKVWDQVAECDPTDPDVVSFYLQKQVQDREFFYFSDQIKDGRRFLAYPRGLMYASAYGLLGCLAFLTVTRFANFYPILDETFVLLSLFCLSVMGPWTWIIITFMRGLRDITITKDAITVASRVCKTRLKWEDLRQVSLVRSHIKGESYLSLVLQPNNPELAELHLDLTESTTHLRARQQFVHEVLRHSGEPHYISADQLASPAVRPIAY